MFRALIIGLTAAVAYIATMSGSLAQDKIVKVGIMLSLTGPNGPNTEDSVLYLNGFMMAIDEQNAKGGIAGYKIEPVTYDNGSAASGQAGLNATIAATNIKKLVADPAIVVVLGPSSSGEGKVMAPILSEAGMAAITSSSTNSDITDPKFVGQFRPQGKPIYFRTVTTDAFQGPNMANFYAQTLKAKSVYLLDDSGVYGVGMVDGFQKRAESIGIKILGRDQVNPKEADYTTILAKIKALNPEAIYFGGQALTGAKLAKQAYDIIPNIPKGGGDALQGGNFLKGAGFPAVAGWYTTNAGPHLVDDPKLAIFVKAYNDRYHSQPIDYTVTSYDAAQVVIDAIKRTIESKKELSRSNVRDAIQATSLPTLQGTISFDENGDIKDRTVSVFQYRHNDKFPDDDVIHQKAYIGSASQG